jgi:hypothetical protein
MNYGAGWIVLENRYPEVSQTVLSVISARRSSAYVAQYIEQLYVDRHASIRERLDYKKSGKNYPYRTQVGLYSGVMHCGQSPVLHGIYAHKIMLSGNQLAFTYKILVRQDPLHTPVFESRRQVIPVDV